MKPLFKKGTKCYVCGRKATALYHKKRVCDRCYKRLRYPRKRSITMNQLLELQKKVNKELDSK